jgi:hypothetical protein
LYNTKSFKNMLSCMPQCIPSLLLVLKQDNKFWKTSKFFVYGIWLKESATKNHMVKSWNRAKNVAQAEALNHFAYFNMRCKYLQNLHVFLVWKYIWGRVKWRQVKIIVINKRKTKFQTRQLSSFLQPHSVRHQVH